MLLKQALQSRVGQRLFLRFAFAVLLPILALAGYAYSKVTQVLTESTHQRLQQESKSLGMTVMDRLNKQAQALPLLVHEHPAAMSADWLKLAGFSRIEPATQAIQSRLTPEQSLRLTQGQVVLLADAPNAGDLSFLIETVDHTLMLGALNTERWWQDDRLPERFCTLLDDGKPLYCSAALAATPHVWQQARLEAAKTGNYAIDAPFGGMDIGVWHVRLTGQFALPGLIFVVAEQDQSASWVRAQFKLFFIALALLGLGSAAWLALRQIRQQLLPLNQLIAGTQRVAAGDFERAIVPVSDDEFGQLALDFNAMSARLNRKFHVLQKLDEIDRVAAKATHPSDLFYIFFNRLYQSLPADSALIIHHDESGEFVFYAAGKQSYPAVCMPQSASSCATLFAQVKQRPAEFAEISDINQVPCLAGSRVSGMQQALVLPIEMSGEIAGLLIFGFARRQEIQGDTIQSAQLFAERLSVAVAKLAADQKLYYQAHYDALTQLPNRVLFEERTVQALFDSASNGTVTALLLVDLDGFKNVNDSLGHAAGDALLKVCAQRLQAHLRPCDVVARYGGDEFILLLPNLNQTSAVDEVLSAIETLRQAFGSPIDVLGRSVLVEFSTGVALYPHDAQHFDGLLKMADTAMYSAKKSPDKSFAFYEQAMNHEVNYRFELMQELRVAFAQNELILFYQPKVDAVTGQIVGAEALCRWLSTKRGLVPPVVFIPLLDQMGLGQALGEWVLDTVCAQMQSWDQQDLPSLPVSINLSPVQFLDASLCSKVQAALSRCHLASARLEIEILEDTAVERTAIVQHNLATLRQMDVCIALDDFGTGYSSLVNLINVPANVLKLDRTFISDIATNVRQQSVVEHIIALAKTLGFSLVAEGVETQAQAQWLAAQGCDKFQGYLYGRPMTEMAFNQQLRDQQEKASQAKG